MQLEKTVEAAAIDKVKPLTEDQYRPRGGTPLIDAVCATIQAISEAVAGRDDVEVILAIQTDGQEWDSRENTWDDLRALIAEKEKLGWQINFLGAGLKEAAYEQGARMGISRSRIMSYGDNKLETRAAFEASAANTVMYSKGLVADTGYLDSQKLAAGDVCDHSEGRKQQAADQLADRSEMFQWHPPQYFAFDKKFTSGSAGSVTRDARVKR